MDFEDLEEDIEGDDTEVRMMNELNDNKSEMKKQKKRLKTIEELVEQYQDFSQTLLQHYKTQKN